MDQNKDPGKPPKARTLAKLWGTALGFILLIVVIGWMSLAGGCYGNDGVGSGLSPSAQSRLAALSQRQE